MFYLDFMSRPEVRASNPSLFAHYTFPVISETEELESLVYVLPTTIPVTGF